MSDFKFDKKLVWRQVRERIDAGPEEPRSLQEMMDCCHGAAADIISGIATLRYIGALEFRENKGSRIVKDVVRAAFDLAQNVLANERGSIDSKIAARTLPS